MTTQMTRHMPLGFSQEQVQRSHAPCPSRHLKQTNPPTTLPTLSPRTAMQTPSRPLVQDRCIQRAMLHLPCTSSCIQAKKHESTSRAAIVLAAALCAVLIPYTTKPCVAGKLAEVEHAVACSPQWLPRCSCRWPLPPARRPQHRHLSGGSTFARPAPSSWWKYPTGRIRSSP